MVVVGFSAFVDESHLEQTTGIRVFMQVFVCIVIFRAVYNNVQ